MVDNRQGGERRPSRDGKPGGPRGQQHRGGRSDAPRYSGPGRARRAQPDHGGDDNQPQEPQGPRIPRDVEASQLAPEVRRELTTLSKTTADTIARHLVAAGNLLDEDPAAALEHAQAARTRSGRIAAIREAVGIAAYYCGDWTQALAELRAARRMGSRSQLLPMIADCERGVGRPEKAIELSRSPEAADLTGSDADEMRIVVAGARADLGQLEQALAALGSPPPDPAATGATAARLDYAYADILLALGRNEEALQWFLHAAAADIEGVTDAEDRISELA